MSVFTFSGTAVLLGLGGLCLLLTLYVLFLRRYMQGATPSATDGRTKLAGTDPLRFGPTTHRISLCAALLASLLTLNWTQWDAPPAVYSGVIEVDETIDLIPPRTFDPPQPPPPPPPPPTIEAVPDEVAPTVDLIDQGITMNEPVFATVPTHTASRAAPPPPPIAPPPPSHDEDTIEIFVERMPVFGEACKALSGEARKQCSDRALLRFVQGGITYPPLARNNGMEGVVVVQFVVEKDGTVSSLKPIREVGGGCTQAALQAIERINTEGLTFTPGIQAGHPVRVAFNLPVKFQLAN
ncbi:hypothetical protein LEM8419_00573 [Neolewinella maritima]|uniref:TonB C-terminal domain-containing protein n=1 Tax=Neolewinella maritima TaxID=1383882 RepID=A0ABN8EZF1_9BACT|nr:TonB family protein [Neolewinella maritima]CAH0999276.1 hypothetical protein LEM8419_00573 [Neolewinella maritima]